MTDINRDGDGSKSPSSPLTQRRLDLLAAGFTPIPAKGKTTHLSGWTQKNITVDEVVSWESTLPDHYNTGVSTSTTPFLDIDVLNAEAAAPAKHRSARSRSRCNSPSGKSPYCSRPLTVRLRRSNS